MKKELVKKLNRLRVEEAELKTALKQAELNEDYADEKDELEKQLATVEDEIRKLFEKPVEVGNAE